MIVIWIRHQVLYLKDYLGNCERRRPTLFQAIHAKIATLMYVGMIYLGLELASRRMERIVAWKSKVNEERTTSVWSSFCTFEHQTPNELASNYLLDYAARYWIFLYGLELFVDPSFPLSHLY